MMLHWLKKYLREDRKTNTSTNRLTEGKTRDQMKVYTSSQVHPIAPPPSPKVNKE
jgi:hypothetical protein